MHDQSPTAGETSGMRYVVANHVERALLPMWNRLHAEAGRERRRSLLITSAEPGEGVSYVTVALALLAASADAEPRLALTEWNLQRPSFARLLDTPSSPGLVDVLAGRVSLDAAMSMLVSPKVNVLPAGRQESAAPALSRTEAIAGVLHALEDHHDHVFHDAPPVNAHETTQTLAGLCDGVLLVVRAGKTSRQRVSEAIRRIEFAGGRCLGIILNRWSSRVPAFLESRPGH
jgi:Mrp family chromosome partitioning ATPase